MDWDQILANHGPRVWRTIYRLLNHDADANDCYQNTFLAAFRFTQRSVVADWPALLTSLATRQAMDRLRQRYRAQALTVELGRVPEPVSDTASPASALRARELMEQLRRAMARLPEKQSEVFWMSCLEGMEHSHIAERLQIKPGEVRVLLHRARVTLNQALNLKQLH